MIPPGWNPAAGIILRVLQTGRKSRAAGFAIKRHGILKPYMAKGNTSSALPPGFYYYVPVIALSENPDWIALSSNDKLVYSNGLCSFGGKDFNIPAKGIPLKYIAQRAGCTERGASKSLRRLESGGWITVTGNDYSAKQYKINYARIPHKVGTPFTPEQCSPPNNVPTNGAELFPESRNTVQGGGEQRSPQSRNTVHHSIKDNESDNKLTTQSLIALWVETDKSKGGIGKVTGQAAKRAKDLWTIALSVNGKSPDKAIDWWARVLESVFSQKAWPFSEGLGSCGLIAIHRHLQTALDGLPKKKVQVPDEIRRNPEEYQKWLRRNRS